MALTTLLALGHLLGLVLGLGAAALLDLYLLGLLRGRRVTTADRDLFRFAMPVVATGLGLLWMTGLGFLAHYGATDPSLLANPKLHSKLAIVSILTVNGFALHVWALPLFERNLGRPLLAGLSQGRRAAVLAAGAVSGTCWLAALGLGEMRELNFAAPAWMFLGAFGAALGFSVLCATVLAAWVGPRHDDADAMPAGLPA